MNKEDIAFLEKLTKMYDVGIEVSREKHKDTICIKVSNAEYISSKLKNIIFTEKHKDIFSSN